MKDFQQRQCGVLLHPTCLPSPYGVGDFGPGATAYLQWLADAGVTWWQILPLTPPGPGYSPYSSTSTFAGNTLLISPDRLLEEHLLLDEHLEDAPDFVDHLVDLRFVAPWKQELLRKAYRRFRATQPAALEKDFATFRNRHQGWLDDFCLYTVLKRTFDGEAWNEWPESVARREPEAVERWRREVEEDIFFEAFCQFLFFRQWTDLRTSAAELGIKILGDVPIFADHDSADVWVNQQNYLLDDRGRPTAIAGVPPDYFSETGQLWGNPIYDWQQLESDGYRWWVDRLRHTLDLVDAVRLDHFRGFFAHWEVPTGAETAVDGSWKPGPGKALFDAVEKAVGGLPFVAEDLGTLTDEVAELRKALGLPGMAVLQFGFSTDPRSSFIPYALERDLVVYTGTHDNNTALGWYMEDATEEQKDLLRRYAGTDGSAAHWDLVRLALASVADLAVIPHQDLVGLGGDCRMNKPGLAEGNWRFRITPWMLDDSVRDRFADLIRLFGRERDQTETATP